MKRLLQFFRDSYAELRKVVWPSREEVGSSTKVVIISTIIFAALLGLFDFIFTVGRDIIF
ncbi:preprotein translocase subunit SecE [Marispirochaeta aestuarii]|jgi:preprotein translocase subunit SecE|uniref:Protein translocase subunit SecE n=1 Tax=Marispirochaeta aestuarii TaxID=1963862 RepID=A0A1Y1S3I7_9SPIO|nr:preprotein translocase subunit SecE [Marispirochaeta aestuarii]ORC38195.1 preprotein translocase subunit SecE [Marispirochaeta aestuarii]